MEPIGSDTVLLFSNDGLGSTDYQELRHRLEKTYLTMILDNSGGDLLLYGRGGPYLQRLAGAGRAAAAGGAGEPLIICKTCLDYLHLAGERQVGIVGGMADIIEAQRQAGKVITL